MQRREDWELAEAAYQKVVDLDPSFAPAWARLASILAVRSHPEDPPEERHLAQARALEAAERAIAVGPGAPDGYSARGFLRARFHHDRQGSLADFERALALFPGDELTLRRYSGALLLLGRPAEAVAAARRAVDIEPVSAQTWSNLAWVLFWLGKVDLARSAVDRALEITPGFFEAATLLAEMELLEGRAAAALAASAQVPYGTGFPAFIGAAVQQVSGHPDANGTLQSFIARWGGQDPYGVAELYAWRGDYDGAFEWLDRALATGEADVDQVALDPLLRSLHGDPRWKPLLRKLNLPTP
jgi:tetratricopeptide (TPR) repeat protein